MKRYLPGSGLALPLLLLLVFALLFAACDPPVEPVDPTVTDPTAESIAMPGAQVPSSDAVISIDRIVSRENGWIVLLADDGSGAPGTSVLGHRAIDSGTSTNLSVGLQGAVANGDRIWAVLYRDSGQVGVFEPTGADRRAVGKTGLDVGASTYIRWLSGEDQILDDNQVTIDTVRSAVPVWILIYISDLSGNPSVLIGQQHAEEGTTANMKVLLDTAARRAVIDGDRLWAVMAVDQGTVGEYEPGVDQPFLWANQPIRYRFRIGAALDPVITVSNQPVSNGAITVPQVEATKVGWLVIRESKADGTANMSASIGRARVSIGINRGLRIALSKTIPVGNKLWAMLHEDTGSLGKFEYTSSSVVDVPILVGGQPAATTFKVQ
jgi:hypothetical protein